MTSCLLSFLVPFFIGLGLGDSHLVILSLCSLALSLFVISASLMFLLFSLFLYSLICFVLLCIWQFFEYTYFLLIKKESYS